jgi:gas vesicle protein
MGSGRLVGVLLGLTAVAFVGFLFATEKGTKLRKKIYRRGAELSDGMEENFNEFIDNVTEKFKGESGVAENLKTKSEGRHARTANGNLH